MFLKAHILPVIQYAYAACFSDVFKVENQDELRNLMKSLITPLVDLGCGDYTHELDEIFEVSYVNTVRSVSCYRKFSSALRDVFENALKGHVLGERLLREIAYILMNWNFLDSPIICENKCKCECKPSMQTIEEVLPLEAEEFKEINQKVSSQKFFHYYTRQYVFLKTQMLNIIEDASLNHKDEFRNLLIALDRELLALGCGVTHGLDEIFEISSVNDANTARSRYREFSSALRDVFENALKSHALGERFLEKIAYILIHINYNDDDTLSMETIEEILPLEAEKFEKIENRISFYEENEDGLYCISFE